MTDSLVIRWLEMRTDVVPLGGYLRDHNSKTFILFLRQGYIYPQAGLKVGV